MAVGPLGLSCSKPSHNSKPPWGDSDWKVPSLMIAILGSRLPYFRANSNGRGLDPTPKHQTFVNEKYPKGYGSRKSGFL